jgi:hypothetical protein
MRGLFGVVGLLVALAIVGVLAKKNLSSVTTVAPPAGMASAPAGATVKQQSQLIQQQVQQSVEATVQQARPMPEDK